MLELPEDYRQYDSQYGGQLEMVDSVLWDTERYQGSRQRTEAGDAYDLMFFQTVKQRPREGNMWYPGMLPMPCGFIVRRVKVRGLTSHLAKGGVFRFVIGNKFMLELPLDDLTRHQKFYQLDRPLFIAPQVCFYVSFKWDSTRYRGGQEPKLEVRLQGIMARPRQ